jgi:hypothetical protein
MWEMDLWSTEIDFRSSEVGFWSPEMDFRSQEMDFLSSEIDFRSREMDFRDGTMAFCKPIFDLDFRRIHPVHSISALAKREWVEDMGILLRHS